MSQWFESFDEVLVELECKQVINSNFDNISLEVLKYKLLSEIIPRYYEKAT